MRPRPLREPAQRNGSVFKYTISETAKALLGHKTRVDKEWFDKNQEAMSAALDAKNKAYSEWKNGLLSVSRKDRFIHLRSNVRLS